MMAHGHINLPAHKEPGLTPEQFTGWLRGFLAGADVFRDPAVAPSPVLAKIQAELDKMAPKVSSVTIRGSDIISGSITADKITAGSLAPREFRIGDVTARTLELRPAEIHLQGFARGGIVNAVAHGTLGSPVYGAGIDPVQRGAINDRC